MTKKKTDELKNEAPAPENTQAPNEQANPETNAPVEGDKAPVSYTPEQVQEILDNVGPKVMVVFDYIRNDATRGTDRVFLRRLRDIRTVADIEEIEKRIIEQSQGALARVTITNWKALEA